MSNTKIEWAEKVWNPVTGCSKVSAGCANCYAERMSKRLAGRCGYPPAPHNFDVTIHGDKLGKPSHWRKHYRVFVCSMGDLFHDDVPFAFIEQVYLIIVKHPLDTFIVLTKRPQRALEFYKWWDYQSGAELEKPLDNVWFGVTAENQATANERIPLLLHVPAAVRWVSVEPMLMAIDVNTYLYAGINWVVCGAETGPHKRIMQFAWPRSLRDQCKRASVPFFFKKDSYGNHALDDVVYEEYPQ